MINFCDSRGRTLLLGNELGKGGEARVYRVINQSNVAAKIYTRPSQHGALTEKQEKLNTMLAIAPRDPAASQHHVSIAWPTDTVYDDTGTFAGFLMPSVEAIGTLRDISNPSARHLRGLSGFTSIYLHRAAANVCHSVAAIHDVGHVIGDLNPNNVLVNRQSLATLIDTDSYQISNASGRVFRCGVGVPEYMAPERARGTSLLSAAQDEFALAILIFEMLMGGFHPYAGGAIIAVQSTAQLTTSEYMKQGLFPFVKNAFAAPPDGAPDFQLLHAEVRDAFTRTFIYGSAAPNLRLAPREWATLVRRAEDDLAPCHKNPEHYAYQSIGACMWCEQEARITRLRGRTQQPMAVPVNTQSPPAAATPHQVPSPARLAGLQPVRSSTVGPATVLGVVLFLALLGWLIYSAVQPNASVEANVPAQIATQTTGQATGQPRHDEEARATQLAERRRVEKGVAGLWANGPLQLTITKDGNNFRAIYRFPDTDPFSRGEGHQTMHGELLPNNELKLSNIYLGKIANPLDYWPGDFSGQTWVTLSPDGTFVTARFTEAKGGQIKQFYRSTSPNQVDASAATTESEGQQAAPGERRQEEEVQKRSEAETSIIHVDRSTTPDYSHIGIQNRGIALWNPELENSGPTQFDAATLEKYEDPRERRFVYDDLKASGMLERCLNLQDLQAIKARGPEFFHKHFGNRYEGRGVVLAWRSIVDIDAVPFMSWPQLGNQPQKNFMAMIPYLSSDYADSGVSIVWAEFNQGSVYYDLKTPIYLYGTDRK